MFKKIVTFLNINVIIEWKVFILFIIMMCIITASNVDRIADLGITLCSIIFVLYIGMLKYDLKELKKTYDEEILSTVSNKVCIFNPIAVTKVEYCGKMDEKYRVNVIFRNGYEFLSSHTEESQAKELYDQLNEMINNK